MKKALIFTLMLVSLGACQQDLLDKGPLDAVSEVAVWGDIYLAEAQLNDAYTNLYDGFSRRQDNWGYGVFMLDACSDDGKASYTWTEAEKFLFSSYTANDPPLRYTWQDMYSAIYKTNLFLSKIDGVPGGEKAKKDQLKAEAKFLRSFFYFELMRQYGGVPLIGAVQNLGSDLVVARSSYAECTAFVVRDLDEVAAVLSLKPTQVGRATKGAALALKARALLYAASPLHNTTNDAALWTRAADGAKAVMNLGAYSLFPDYETLFWPANENNAEVIFDKQYRYPINAHSYNTFQTPYSRGGFSGGWGGSNATQEFVNAFEMTDGKAITESPLYAAKDPYKNRDPRFYSSVLFDGATFMQLGTTAKIETRQGGDNSLEANSKDATKTGYYTAKFLDPNDGPNYSRFENGAAGEQNWIFMRYAEVLLNYAEAQNEAVGPDASVYAAINQVRARVKMPALPTGLGKDQMRGKIRNERRVELSFEEHRFWDIRRWKIADQVSNKPVTGVQITVNADGSRNFKYAPVETRVFAAKNYLQPILQDEVNKSSGKVTQNPGW